MQNVVFAAPWLLAAMLLAAPGPAVGSESNCAEDGVQESGAIYRICMPAPGEYNGRLVIWAHGFQDATEPVGIPEEQLCIDGVCLNELFNGLGYGFATSSYSKTGLAIVAGAADILDLVQIFGEEQGVPERVYLVGASQGGAITALLTESDPQVFDGGVAACGPVGNFRRQLEYLGNARLVFEVLWPGLLPGGPFEEPPEIAENWPVFFDSTIRPALAASPVRLREWVAAAGLPVDPANFQTTALNTAEVVLRYAVVNTADTIETLGGFPFGNLDTEFEGLLLTDYINANVQRREASPEALAEIAARYETTGELVSPLVSIHTTRDELVPYFHVPAYLVKTWLTGAFPARYFHIPVERYGHCAFTSAESLVAFLVMLVYVGDLFEVQGVGEVLPAARLDAFRDLADRYGIPYRIGGPPRVLVAPPTQ